MGLCLCTDRDQPAKPVQAIVACVQAFKQPSNALAATAGGGARFYRLVPVCDDTHQSSTEDACGAYSDDCCATASGNDGQREWQLHSGEVWLGKDTAGSLDELEFHDTAMRLRYRRSRDNPADICESDCWRIFDYLVSYHGLLKGQICHVPGSVSHFRERPLDLLVVRSPLEGLARPRLLHLEVGPRTTALQHRRGSDVDTASFSRQEGIRVEGFLAPPQSVASEEATHDARGWTWGECTQRRAKRMPLQRLNLTGALTALVDFRDAISEERLWPSESIIGFPAFAGKAQDAFLDEFLGPAEYAELSLLSLVRELASLLRACGDVPVPQKWVGSSLALLVEVGAAPPRTSSIDPLDWVAARVKLRLFGWNRSRVSSQLSGQFTSLIEQQDNELLWQIYQDSLARVLWEASRLYFHTFCIQDWTKLRIEVFEISPRGEEISIGVAEAGLEEGCSVRRALPLTTALGVAHIYGTDGKPATVVITVSFAECPVPSRFRGVWRVIIDSATRLPAPSTATTESPGSKRPVSSSQARCMFATVTARGPAKGALASEGVVSFQRTSPVSDRHPAGPVWKEEFEFLVARAEDMVSGVIEARLAGALGLKHPAQDLDAAPRSACPTGVRAPRAGDSDSCSIGLAKRLPPPELHGELVDGNAQESVRDLATRQLAFVELLRSELACESDGANHVASVGANEGAKLNSS